MPDSNTNNNNNSNNNSNNSGGSKKIFGIDLSHHNGAVDFNKVKAAGVQFVILRCGYASTSNRNSYGKDKKFEEYYSAAKSAGLAIGTYFYSMCNSKETGKAEADFILKTIAGKTFEYPVWLDVENTSNLNSVNKETMTDAVETCLETIKAAGYKVGIYTGVYIARDNLVQSRIDKYDVWIAQWANSCSYSGNLCMWQFGGETNKLRSVKVDGVSSAACDQNYSFVDYAAGETSSGKNNPFGDGSGTGSGSGSGGSGGGNLSLIFNNTTTTQESLPNANVSDNWVDMHKIKGITLHMYPPYHNCVADSMVKSFEALGWDRNFHYKVDKDTVVDFDAKPVSGEGTGGNKVGSSVSVFEVVPKDPLNYSVIVSGGVTNANGSGGSSGGSGGSSTPGGTVDGSDVPSKIYNYCVSQGCSAASACGIVGNAEIESGFDPSIKAYDGSGSIGLFQWLATRRTALENEAKSAGVSATDADFQIKFMWKEWTSNDYGGGYMQRKKGVSLEQWKALSDPKEAAALFAGIFERGADGFDSSGKRGAAAQKWYEKFSQQQNSNSGSDSGSGSLPPAEEASIVTAEITPRNIWYQDNSGITEEDLNKPATMPGLGEDVPLGDDGIMVVDSKPKPFGWPVPGQKYIQSYYGYRTDVLGYKFHSGIDIVSYPGDGAFCYANGRVMKVQTDTVLNGYVRVDHENGVQTVYGSLKNIYVEEGMKVQSGQCIGTTHSSEANPLYHLHFAMIINGKYVDPLYYVKQGGGNRRYPDNFGIPNEEDKKDETNEVMAIDNYGISTAAAPGVQNGLWIGDSRLVAMEQQKIVDSSVKVVAKGGKAAQYFLNNYNSLLGSLSGGNYSHIAVLLGVNDPGSNINSTKNLLTKLRSTFPNVPIYMMQPLPATSEWRYTGLTTVTGSMLKEQLDKFKTEVGNHCTTVGNCYWGSATINTLVDSNGYLIPKYAYDGVHLTTEGYKIYYNNLVSVLNGNSSDSNNPNDGTGNGGSGTGNLNQGDSLGDSTVGDSGDETYDPGRENPVELSWDNVDKGRILFASADNNTHTYIDANLFNNQHPKYTLSIGSFFYDEYDLVEKSADVDYPATEKILIQQCAKALYDEGFTSKELWREFDLNRAPSPFLYLDREKWIAFCAEVDKQVEWLNKKYGKVTATYKSNALLKNYHRNEFVESAPMPVGGTGSGGTGDSSGSSGSGGAGGAGFLWPAPGNTRISSPFGPRKAPTAGASTNHKGIDIPGASNSQIIATKSGTVSSTVSGSASAGNYVVIDHDGGYRSRYLHLNSYSVKQGDTVNQGDEIGKMGNTGIGTGTHLHFEIHENGTPVDPQKYVDPSNSKANAESDKDKESSDNNEMGEGTLINADYGIALAEGNIHPASFSAYIPTGNKTANGETTDPSKNTCAAPSEVPFGTKIKVMETGTDKDGQIYTVNDRGGGIKIKNGTYYIDLLVANMSEATQFGRRSGKVEIGASGSSDSGSSDSGSSDSGSSGGSSGGVFSPSGLPIGGMVNQSAWDEEPKYATGDENSYSGLTESGLGASSIDNGGIMEYEVGEPEDASAPQPEIATIITQEEYEAIMEFAKPGEIDIYVNSFEPYDKDLDIAKTIGLTDDTRLETLTETVRTLTENMIRYKVVETGPGSLDHCVKPVDELSVLYKTSECKVEPVYPDLVIPPKYVTSEYDTSSPNSIPITTIEDATAKLEDMMDKSMSYDYELLDEVTKKSSGKPINYYDPYPYDDKIADLEDHSPKVLIDEIESRLYSCNHPGCPIAHPMAKNFAMLNDMAINQSKYTEQRLVRLENILSTMIRYLGRMSSRVNINCVYYGGQTVMGKYKCIRCLRDDRVHDGATVTMDQCLTCTRYEPIIGQVYDILDETGFNGSAILDDMQMSYMSLNDMKNLNKVENRSTVYWYADTNKKEEVIPTSLIDEWKAADREVYLKKIEEEGGKIKTEGDSDSGKVDEDYGVMPIDNTETDINTDTETNTEEKEKDPNKILPSEYLFMMDWNTQAVDLQKPDVKEYPTEKIAAKYFNQASDPGEDEGSTASAEKSVQISLDTDKEVYESISSGEWVDTRTEDDSLILNRYTSLDYYFDKFNLNRTGYEYDNGLAGNVGLTASGGSGGAGSSSGSVGSSVNGTGSEIRKKIVEHAYKIVADHKAGKATYCGTMRTVDPDKPVVYPGSLNGCTNPVTYDCTSFVSCCYKAAGLTSFYAKSASQGSLIAEAKSGGYEMWLGDEAGFAKALPGDVLVKASAGKISNFDASNPPAISHAMIYTATNEISHASQSKPVPNAIVTKTVTASDSYYGGRVFFIRCKELIDADKAAEQQSNIEENPNGDNNGDSGSNNSQDNNNGQLKMPSDGAVAINAGIATASTINTNNNTITTKPSDVQKETISYEAPVSPSYSSEPAYILSSELEERNSKYMIDGYTYACKLSYARCTEHGPWDGTSTVVSKGWGAIANRICGSHNLPCGTKIYIPEFKGVINPDGIFTVRDNGKHAFDFSIATSRAFNITGFYTVYVLSYGSGTITESFTETKRRVDPDAVKYASAWKEYMRFGGCLINFGKFNNQDIMATWWRK